MNGLEESVYAALGEVIDPCSITAGAPLSVVDMGMVMDVSVDDQGVASIGMRATSAMCTMIAGIMKAAEDRIAAVDGVTEVRIKLSSGPVWTEADMTDRGRSILNARRQRSQREFAVKPHEWKTRLAGSQARSS